MLVLQSLAFPTLVVLRRMPPLDAVTSCTCRLYHHFLCSVFNAMVSETEECGDAGFSLGLLLCEKLGAIFHGARTVDHELCTFAFF